MLGGGQHAWHELILLRERVVALVGRPQSCATAHAKRTKLAGCSSFPCICRRSRLRLSCAPRGGYRERYIGAIYANMVISSMISGAQIRAARALLGLSATELARLSGVGHRTVQRFEIADGIPDCRTAIMMQLIKAFETQGIKFDGDPVDSPGVRLFRKSNAGTENR